MEEPDLIPKEQNIDENTTITEGIDNNSDPSKSNEIGDDNLLSDNLKTEAKNNQQSDNLQDESIIQKFLSKGINGVTTNPNYKLLALLVILLINLSIFILIGNLGKSFLANSGLL